MTKQSYFWATPSGPINLIKGEDYPKHPNDRVEIRMIDTDKQVIKDGVVVWSVDVRADDYAYSNAENHAHCLKVQLLKEYEAALQSAKESSVPIQDQERAKRMIMQWLNDQPLGQGMIERDRVHGPFTVEYRLETINPCQPYKECQHPGENGWKCLHTCKLQHLVAILYDDTPEKETQEVSITVSKSAIPKNARLVEAYETEHRIIVMFAAGEEIPEDHNCDWMGCGSFSHVKYILTKPDSSL